MAGVGRDDGKSILQACAHVEIIDTASEPAIADSEEAVVPVLWKPESKREGGAGGRSHVDKNSAEGWKIGGVGRIGDIMLAPECRI